MGVCWCHWWELRPFTPLYQRSAHCSSFPDLLFPQGEMLHVVCFWHLLTLPELVGSSQLPWLHRRSLNTKIPIPAKRRLPQVFFPQQSHKLHFQPVCSNLMPHPAASHTQCLFQLMQLLFSPDCMLHRLRAGLFPQTSAPAGLFLPQNFLLWELEYQLSICMHLHHGSWQTPQLSPLCLFSLPECSPTVSPPTLPPLGIPSYPPQIFPGHNSRFPISSALWCPVRNKAPLGDLRE